MEGDETQEIQELQEEPWEERTLNVLHDSKIDQDFSKIKTRKCGRRNHKVRRMMKRPMAIPETILDLQHQARRESSLRCLSNFLLEKREEDPENYNRTGFLLYNSCSTMAILLQEILVFSQLLADGNLTVRASKRVVNVLTLFQCVAANNETRYKFVKSFVPNFVVPLIPYEASLEIYENVRAVALSVMGILCQAREPKVIQWALESNMVDVCRISIEIGSELSKVGLQETERRMDQAYACVCCTTRPDKHQCSKIKKKRVGLETWKVKSQAEIGMHILEAILQDDLGMSYICSQACDQLLMKLMKTWKHLVACLAEDQEFSPRLLFHIIRCYALLCTHVRGLSVVMESLPDSIADDSFGNITAEFPLIGSLLQQLLLSVGKIDDYCPDFPLDDLILY